MTGKSTLTASCRSLNPWRSGELTLAITISNLAFPLEIIDIAAEASSTIVTETTKADSCVKLSASYGIG